MAAVRLVNNSMDLIITIVDLTHREITTSYIPQIVIKLHAVVGKVANYATLQVSPILGEVLSIVLTD
jgi:hypothetical protein